MSSITNIAGVRIDVTVGPIVAQLEPGDSIPIPDSEVATFAGHPYVALDEETVGRLVEAAMAATAAAIPAPDVEAPPEPAAAPAEAAPEAIAVADPPTEAPAVTEPPAPAG